MNIASHRNRRLSLLACVSLLGLSCASAPGSGSDAENTGQALITITQAPSDALCAVITVAGSRTVSQQISLMPGETTVFSLNGLPVGSDIFSAKVFGVACAQVDYGGNVSDPSVPTWVSDAVPAPISKNAVTRVTLPMHPSGRASVGLDFDGGPANSSFFVELSIPTANADAEYIAAGIDNDIFFTETQANQLGHVDAQSKISETPLPAGIIGPEALVVDPTGRVWFATRQGVLAWSASVGFSLARTRSPVSHVVLAADGTLWFTEHTGNRVGRLSIAAPKVSEFALPAGSGPDGLTIGADGGVWVALEDANAIARLDAQGAIVNRIPLAGDRPGGGCLMIGGDGRVWFSDFLLDSLVRLPPGPCSQANGACMLDTLQLSAGARPRGIVAVGGNTWFTESGLSLIGWANANGGLVEIPTPTPNANPVGITLRTSGPNAAGVAAGSSVWFVETAANKLAYFPL